MPSNLRHRFFHDGSNPELVCPHCGSKIAFFVQSQWHDSVTGDWVTDASWNECPRCGHAWAFQPEEEPDFSMSDA